MMNGLLISFIENILQDESEKNIKLLEKAIASNPNRIDNFWYLGIAYLLNNEIETAQATWMSALFSSEDTNQDTQLLISILQEVGTNLINNKRLNQAQLIFEQIIDFDEENLDNYRILARIYRDLNQNDRAEFVYQHLIENNTQDINDYIQYSYILLTQYQYDRTITVLENAIQQFPKEQRLYLALVQILKSNGQADKAISFAEKGLAINPQNLVFQLENLRILPILYKTETEIEYYRQRFISYLDKVINLISLKVDLEPQHCLLAIHNGTNFYLQYQGKNDTSLQQKFNNLVHFVTNKNYPNTNYNFSTNTKQPNQKKIIGFISAHFRDHNGANWSLEWIKNIDRNKFIINCYYLENTTDRYTKEFEKYSDNFYFLPNDLIAISQQVIKDNIQVLVYTDIGMKAITTELASLRLAPIQCVTLGHPITSGLPTIDYYISRRLMEPQNADSHYTENLFLLPNIGLYLQPQKLPNNPQTRSDFGLENNSIIYLSCQSLFKYLPQFDYIYPVIAQQISSAKFIFIEFPISNFVNQIFRKRLANIFSNYGLDYQDYCVILPRLNNEKFMSITMLADIFLDTFTWSADNTTRLAIDCDLPVVTCPGEFMRGRHSYGILKMIEVEETIAYSEQEYIDIAVRLGKDANWRNEIKTKIRNNKHKLYHDRQCIEALENFFEQVVESQT